MIPELGRKLGQHLLRWGLFHVLVFFFFLTQLKHPTLLNKVGFILKIFILTQVLICRSMVGTLKMTFHSNQFNGCCNSAVLREVLIQVLPI